MRCPSDYKWNSVSRIQPLHILYTFSPLYIIHSKWQSSRHQKKTSHMVYNPITINDNIIINDLQCEVRKLSINLWMSWSTLDNNKVGKSVRLQNDHVQKLSYVKVIKYGKWPNIWHDKLIKERGLSFSLLLQNTYLI